MRSLIELKKKLEKIRKFSKQKFPSTFVIVNLRYTICYSACRQLIACRRDLSGSEKTQSRDVLVSVEIQLPDQMNLVCVVFHGRGRLVAGMCGSV